MKFKLRFPGFFKGRKFKRLAIVAIVLFIIITPIFLFVRNLNSPSYGQIKPVLPSNIKVVPNPDYSTLRTQYFSLNYLDSYELQPLSPPDSDLILQREFIQTLKPPASGTSNIDLSIKILPVGELVLDKTYVKYQSNPKDYKLTNKFYQSEPVDLAVKISGGNERGALWEHGKYLLSITLNSSDQKQDLGQVLRDMLSSVQWME